MVGEFEKQYEEKSKTDKDLKWSGSEWYETKKLFSEEAVDRARWKGHFTQANSMWLVSVTTKQTEP